MTGFVYRSEQNVARAREGQVILGGGRGVDLVTHAADTIANILHALHREDAGFQARELLERAEETYRGDLAEELDRI